MNLKEIKQRVEDVKYCGDAKVFSSEAYLWAADTILQLVAEVEHTKKEYREYIDEKHIESMEYAQRCDDYKIKIEKLAAANKILRDGLQEVVNADIWEFSEKAHTALHEADELMK